MQHATRRLAWIGVVTLAFAAGGSVLAVEQGEQAPPWKAHDFAGKTIDFPAVAQGKPAIIVFWATWCPYCKAFMPYLKNIEADYAKRGVKVIAIDVKEDGRGDPRAYVKGLGFTPVAIVESDGNEIMKAYGIRYIPGLLIVDGKGDVAYRRPWSDLPAGREVAEVWDGQVRTALDALVHR